MEVACWDKHASTTSYAIYFSHSPELLPIPGPSMVPNYLQDYHSSWGGSSVPQSPSMQSQSLHSPAPSDSGSSFGNSMPPSRANSFSGKHRAPSHQPSMIDPALDWPWEKQQSFEVHITHLTASAGFPLAWVDNNMEWIEFYTAFLLAAKLPLWKTLICCLLPATVEELCTSMKAAMKGHERPWKAMKQHSKQMDGQGWIITIFWHSW